MSITGGLVTFEQSRKLAEYENRKVLVTFNVTNEQGAEGEVSRALDIAKGLVYGALGLTVAPTPPPQAVITGEVIPPAKTTTKKGKAKDAVPDPAAMGDAPAQQQTADPASVVDVAAVAGSAPAAAGAPDPLAFLNAAPAAPITDKQLAEATMKKNAELLPKHKEASRKLIGDHLGKFVAFPKGLADIPAEQRQSYLDGLAALA